MFEVKFAISFEGSIADNAKIDFYDVAQALIGFQRSLALTTHLVLNNEIITQAPSLKKAEIIASPPEDGSWRIVAAVIGGLSVAGAAPRDSTTGHLIYSAYDYIVSQTLGFHIDFDKSLGQQYEEMKADPDQHLPILDETRFDSLAEKIETAIKDMHRPLVKSGSADSAKITAKYSKSIIKFEHDLTPETYEYVRQTKISEEENIYQGKISSYNINTFRGRIYLESYNRTIPFELMQSARSANNIRLLMRSMDANSSIRTRHNADVSLRAFSFMSKNGRLKSLVTTKVFSATEEE